MEATAGSAKLLGRPAREARAHVGYLTQAFSLYPDLSVAENLRYVGELRRVPDRDIAQRGARYLTMFGMERFTDRLAGRLSGGMKQKLALACALVAEPRVLLLDEPTTGVDPVSRREFWDALAQLSSEGITILLATPYLDEAERCHRVALMHDGRIHRTGTPAELRQSLGLERLEVHAADLRRAATALAHARGHRRRPALRRSSRRDGARRRGWASARCERRWAAPASVSTACGPPRRRWRTRSSPSCASSSRERHVPPFPGAATRHAGGPRGGHRRPRPAQDLRRLHRGQGHRPRGRLRRGLRPARRQRRGEDDHDQDAVRPDRAERGRRPAGRRDRRAALCRPCGSRWATCRRSSRSTTT